MQRKLARKLRLSNPQNFNEKGAVIKGSKHWIKTNEYKKLENKVNYLNHKLASRRKQEHGILVNKIVKESCVVKSERLSCKAFQKMYGKSTGKSAPSMFIKLLQNKLEIYSGTFVDIPTRTTKLSQTCI
ncbi:hypothetical protein [Clostridium sp.]|uniref:hypothetical protein n=1 Tax=Clostridium sp. TaxID=1506 RepID=UPI001B7C8DCD|nr:hypothetical protein [Clostridium sp.]MBP3917216.1 hypothetical protein [Clostridium sp.]